MITNLVNPIIVEVTPLEWELKFTVNCCKVNRDSLERENYRHKIWI